MTDSLEDALNKKSLTKEEAIDGLASSVAHYFNNVLTRVIGYIELAQMKGKAQKYHQALEKPSRQLQGLLQMIHDKNYPVTDYPSKHLSEALTYVHAITEVYQAIPKDTLDPQFRKVMDKSVQELNEYVSAWDIAEQVLIADPALHTAIDYLPGRPMVDIALFKLQE